MANTYVDPGPSARTISTLTGQFLARNRSTLAIRAFMAADLRSGRKVLAEPTRAQAGALARCSATAVYWAEQRQNQRLLIETGLVPLVPPAPVHRANGTAIVPALAGGIDSGARLSDFIGLGDAELEVIANAVGPGRMIAAARSVKV